MLDQWLLLKINREWTNSFFDWLFPLITDWHKTEFFKMVFVPAIAVLLVLKYRKSGALLFVTLITSLGASDFISGRLIKHLVQRLRPPEAGVDVILRAPHYGQLSFPSGHATNMFCAAVFLSLCFPRGRWIFFSIAALVAYSRPYVGVHYPLDIAGGALVGSLIGWAGCRIFQAIHIKFLKKQF